jgi:hypothetical protein
MQAVESHRESELQDQITLSTNITKVYTFSMTTYVCVQFKDIEKPIKVEADKLEKTATIYTLKKGTETVGELVPATVAGWWIEEAR